MLSSFCLSPCPRSAKIISAQSKGRFTHIAQTKYISNLVNWSLPPLLGIRHNPMTWWIVLQFSVRSLALTVVTVLVRGISQIALIVVSLSNYRSSKIWYFLKMVSVSVPPLQRLKQSRTIWTLNLTRFPWM